MKRFFGIIVALGILGHDSFAEPRVDRIRANAPDLPDVRPDLVAPAVHAALVVETRQVPAELILAMGWEESRLDPTERTGSVCGPLQVSPHDMGLPHRETCVLWSTDPIAGWRAGVDELELMMTEPRVHGNLDVALRYKACGSAAFNGTCSRQKLAIVRGWKLMAAALRERTHHVTEPLDSL